MAHVRRFLLALAGVGVALALSAVASATPEERLTAFESAGAVSLARGVGVAVLILLFWLPTFRSWSWRLAGVGLIVFLLVAQLGTGARGPTFLLLGVAGTTVLAGLMLGSRNVLLPRYTALGLIALTLFVGMMVAWTSPIVPEQSRERIAELSLASLVEDPSANVRLEAWDEAGETFQEHPVFGIGVGGLSTFGIGRFLVYPHNMLLEIGAELGLLGLGLFGLLLLAVLLKLLSACAAIRRIPRADLTVPLIVLALLLFSLANAMVSGDLNDGRMLWLMFGVTLAVVALVGQPNSNAARSVPYTEALSPND
jgi:O-antigen ligase